MYGISAKLTGCLINMRIMYNLNLQEEEIVATLRCCISHHESLTYSACHIILNCHLNKFIFLHKLQGYTASNIPIHFILYLCRVQYEYIFMLILFSFLHDLTSELQSKQKGEDNS